jgi:hypothetical protein
MLLTFGSFFSVAFFCERTTLAILLISGVAFDSALKKKIGLIKHESFYQ